VTLLTANHFPFAFSPNSSARFCAEQRSTSVWTQKKWQGFLIGWNAGIRFGNFVCLTLHARPSHRLAIVTAAENHFLAANDNHDIANRRILITPDHNFRRSVFAGHRNLPESISRLDDTGRLVRLLAAKTEFKTIASKIIQHPAVTIERIKLRRRVIELSV
jgi:hypothetical protein